MRIVLSVDNRFLNLCKVSVKCDNNGKMKLDQAWSEVERFIQNSNYDGKRNLLVSLEIDEEIFFHDTKMKMKKESYHDVFEFLESFLQDKIYFYHHLEKEEKTQFLYAQYQENEKMLKKIQQVKRMMRKAAR